MARFHSYTIHSPRNPSRTAHRRYCLSESASYSISIVLSKGSVVSGLQSSEGLPTAIFRAVTSWPLPFIGIIQILIFNNGDVLRDECCDRWRNAIGIKGELLALLVSRSLISVEMPTQFFFFSPFQLQHRYLHRLSLWDSCRVLM